MVNNQKRVFWIFNLILALHKRWSIIFTFRTTSYGFGQSEIWSYTSGGSLGLPVVVR